MKVQLAVVADFANISVEGKLNVMGVFNGIYAEQVPTTHLKMHLVMQYLIEGADRDKTRHIVIKLHDTHNVDLLGLEGSQRFPADAPLGVAVPQIVELNFVRFDEFGEYRFSIEIDEHEVASIPFRVVQASAPQGN